MPLVRTRPPRENRHTLKARKLDARSDRAARRGNLTLASSLEHRADRAARRGGWF